MPGNSFGKLFRITTFGESHGIALGVVIDGCPPRLPLAEGDLEADLARRRPGSSGITTTRNEHDVPEIVSGVYEGLTTGGPICILFRNEDARSRDYARIENVYRPGHADFTFDAKYGHRDPRGGGRASARETVARVAAGAVARKILLGRNIDILGYTAQVGAIHASVDPLAVTRAEIDANPVRCPDASAASEMEARILAIRKAGDSIGGVAEFVARGCPAGLGEPVFDKLKATLAQAFLSIPAVVGFEYGAGFRAAELRGSEHNDPFVSTGGRIHTETNRHGGMLGGISSGEPLLLRACVKPTSSIATTQRTVRSTGEATEVRVTGRHDPCLVPRFVPIGEAMIALVLVDHLMRWLGQLALAPTSPDPARSSSGRAGPESGSSA